MCFLSLSLLLLLLVLLCDFGNVSVFYGVLGVHFNFYRLFVVLILRCLGLSFFYFVLILAIFQWWFLFLFITNLYIFMSFLDDLLLIDFPFLFLNFSCYICEFFYLNCIFNVCLLNIQKSINLFSLVFLLVPLILTQFLLIHHLWWSTLALKSPVIYNGSS